MSHTEMDGNWLKYELTVTDKEGNTVYTDWAYSIAGIEEKFYKLDTVETEYQERMAKEDREEQLSQEFDKKYANGDFADQQILDDDLPDFKDAWIGEQL